MNWKGACMWVLFLGLAFTPAMASAQEEKVPPPGHPLSLPCCECLGKTTSPLNLSTGSANWSVNPGSGPTPTTLSAWDPTPGASWIQPSTPASSAGNFPATTYTYTVRFYVPSCVIPYDSFTLTGSYGADNGAVVKLDTNSVGSCTPSPPQTSTQCFKNPPESLSWSGPLTSPGFHTLSVAVKNEGGYSGLAMNAKLTAQCRKKPTLP